MNKLQMDLTTTWFAHAFQTRVFPEHIWTAISWIAFFFKLASLAFVVPLLGLIAFDFALWIWRLGRSPPKDTSRSSRIPRKGTEQSSTTIASSNSASSSTAFSTTSATSQQRTIYSGRTGD
ncbi:hypothetical protein F5Y04DRAFT_192874 [Hypomontagnella monticulosa]|nr:hypothetical protein F5Y04DRAFT_192874 [Hypomontagnella monticulosa]